MINFKKSSKCVDSYKERNAFMFFNCDEHKSYQTMNPRYNTEVCVNHRAGRRKLWNIIKRELEYNDIQLYGSDYKNIEKSRLQDVRNIILNGNPLELNDIMTYGFITTVEVY